MRILPFKAIIPLVTQLDAVDDFFRATKEKYIHFRQKGCFTEVPSESFYIYKIEGKQFQHYGLISATDVRDAIEGHIIKHEDTLVEKETQMLALSVEREAMIKPVLLIHESVSALDEFIQSWVSENEPFFHVHFKNEQELHTLWQINQAKQIALLQQIFSKNIQKAYIGDGHHRSQTSQLLYKSSNHYDLEASKMLTVYYSLPQVRILAFNRIVNLKDEISAEEFLDALSQFCTISPLKTFKKPGLKRQMVLKLKEEFFLLKWKDKWDQKESDVDVVLDTFLLEKYVLKQILGISDVRNNARIEYVPALESLEFYNRKFASNENLAAFFLHPIDPKDLIKLADAGNTIPAKSTWFQPRIKNALISLSLLP